MTLTTNRSLNQGGNGVERGKTDQATLEQKVSFCEKNHSQTHQEHVVESPYITKEQRIEIPDLPFEGGFTLVIRPAEKNNKRTLPQNASLHLYCNMIAKAMTDAGITQRELIGRFKKGFELPVTGYMIKAIFREVGRAMFEKESTANLTTKEMNTVYMVVDERFGQVTGVTCAWPDRYGSGNG